MADFSGFFRKLKAGGFSNKPRKAGKELARKKPKTEAEAKAHQKRIAASKAKDKGLGY